jgi:hypothetical protein
MEEKLLKLGVERNGVPPPILAHHGPHGRAASVGNSCNPRAVKISTDMSPFLSIFFAFPIPFGIRHPLFILF